MTHCKQGLLAEHNSERLVVKYSGEMYKKIVLGNMFEFQM